MRLLRRNRPPQRRTHAVLRLVGFCTECGRQLEGVQGTEFGCVEGTCPEHGYIADALTA